MTYNVDGTHNLCNPSQNTTTDSQTGRSGDKIQPIRLEARLALTVNPTNANVTGSTNRIMIIRAKQRFVPDTTSVTGTDWIWQTANSASVPLSLFHEDHRKHFEVLYDRLITMGDKATFPMAKIVKINLNLRAKPLTFKLGTTVAESGQIYLLEVANSTAVSNDTPFITGNCRIWYNDL